MREVYEAGSTVRFTWKSDGAPDAPPSLRIFGLGNVQVGSTVVGVPLSPGSTTEFYALFTMPTGQDGVYLWEWRAVQTVDSIARPFIKRREFNVKTTIRSEP